MVVALLQRPLLAAVVDGYFLPLQTSIYLSSKLATYQQSLFIFVTYELQELYWFEQVIVDSLI